jgi:hypothetical protein
MGFFRAKGRRKSGHFAMTSKKKTDKRRKLFIIYDDYYNCVLPFFFL